MRRLRGWAAVFVIAVVYPAAFSMEEGTPLSEDVTLDALVDLSNATAANGTAAAAPVNYSEIKGFALEGGGYTETTGKTLGECKEACTSDSTCMSVNYALISKSMKRKVCRISSLSIQYSEDFVFQTKVHRPQGKFGKHFSEKKWHTFPGLTLVTKDGTKESGATLEQCEASCMAAKKGCEGIAYRARDKLCLMTKKGIAYDEHFDYYEKKASPFVMPQFKVAPNVTATPAANKTDTVMDSTGKKVPCPKAIDDPTIVALEIKEKARLRQAHDATAHAKVKEAQAKATMARLKLSAKQQIAAAKSGEESQLSGMEKSTLTKEDEQLAKAEAKTKMEFLASELKAKSKHAKNSEGRTQERAKKTEDELKRRARKEAGAALGQGRKDAEIAVKKYHASEAGKKAEVVNKKPHTLKSFEAKMKALASGEAGKKAAQKKARKEEQVKLTQANAALKKRLKLRGEIGVKEMKKENAAAAKEMQQKQGEGMTERSMKKAAAERVKAKEQSMKNKVIEMKNRLNAKDLAEYQKAEKRVMDGEAKVASDMAKSQAETKLIKEEAGVDATNKFKTLQIKNRAQAQKQKMKDAGALAETHVVLKNKERMIKGATQSTISKYRREKQIQAEKVEKPKIKKEQKRLRELRASWAKEKKIEHDEMDAVKHKSAQDMARAHTELREVQRRASVQLSTARTNAREVTQKAHEESTLMRAKAKAEAQFHTTKATELAEKTKEKLWKKAMKDNDIVSTNVRADVAAFVDSGPGKHGLNMKQLKRDAEMMRVRMEQKRKVYQAEQKIYDQKRREYHKNVNKENQRYHKANEKGHKEQNRERNEKNKLSPAQKKAQELAKKIKAKAQKAKEKIQKRFSRRRRAEKDELKTEFIQTDATRSFGALRERAGKVKERFQKVAQRAEKHMKKYERRRKADEKFGKAQNKRNHEHHAKNHKLQLAINKAEQTRRNYYNDWRHHVNLHQQTVRKMDWAKRQPANQHYGELPGHAREQGYLRLQRGSHHEQNGLLKFPLRILRPSDTITSANLKLFKYGGWGGPAEVRTIPCDWSRSTVTYTNTMDFEGMRASTGTGSTVDWSTYPPTLAKSEFSSSQNQWTKIKLKGDVLNKARLTASHLCLEVKGGPTKNACVVSSELTRQAPIIELYVKQGSSKVVYGQGDVLQDKRAKKASKAGAASEVDIFERKTRNQLIDQFTKEILARKAKSMNADLKQMKQAGTKKMDATKVKAAVKIKKAASGAIDKQVKAKTMEIEKTENAKVESEVRRSPLKGQQLVILKTKLQAKAQHNIAEKTKAAIKLLEAKAQGAANKQQMRLQARLQTEKMNEKKRSAAAKKKSVTLTVKEKAEIKRRTKFALAIKMAEYMRKKAGGKPLARKKIVKKAKEPENKVERNVQGVGSHGGTCTCPNGKTYQVGDNNNSCKSLACIGGKSGKCSAHNPGGKAVRVTCAKATRKKVSSSRRPQEELELLSVGETGESRGGHVVMLGA